MTDLKQALECCGFQEGESFALGSILDGSIVPSVFTNIERAEQWLAGQVGRNCYLTGNPVKPGTTGRASATDILCRRVLLVDCDPDDGPAIHHRVTILHVAEEIHEAYGGTLVFSGRGMQVWLRVDDSVDCRAFLHGIREKHNRPGVNIDFCHDAPRYMRLPGTINSKTGRMASIVSSGNPGEPWNQDAVDRLNLPTAPERPVTRCEVDHDVDPEEIRSALLEVSPEDYGVWLKVGMALHSVGEREAWDEWSRQSPKFDSSAQEDKWLSFKGEGITLGTLFHLADLASAGRVEKVLTDALADAPSIFSEEAISVLIPVFRDRVSWQRIRPRIVATPGVRITQLEKAIREQTRHERNATWRYASTARFTDKGWFLNSGTKLGWLPEKDHRVGVWIRGQGGDADEQMQQGMSHGYVVEHIPFAEEYGEHRVWNRGASWLVDPVPGPHPTWDHLLEFLGRELNSLVSIAPWCRENGITNGGDYLLAWIGNLAQRPERAVAFLFFTGPQRSGKSMFHESLEYLIDPKGIVLAGNALDNPSNFNIELAGAVLAVIDEYKVDKRKNSKAMARMKRWVTAKTLSVEEKNHTPYKTKNYLSWVHCSNDVSDAIVFDGDTRVTIIEVMKAEGSDQRVKETMENGLKAEAPAFLNTILSMELPDPGPRLAVPALDGGLKEELQEYNKNAFERWCDENPRWLLLSDKELFRDFTDSLDTGTTYWPLRKVMEGISHESRKLRRVSTKLPEGDFQSGDITSENVRQVGRSLGKLVKSGILTVKKVHGNNVYTLFEPPQPPLNHPLNHPEIAVSPAITR